ncbi:MAG: hypothetical protein RL181_833, partial [Bacteroidota bacterium]
MLFFRIRLGFCLSLPFSPPFFAGFFLAEGDSFVPRFVLLVFFVIPIPIPIPVSISIPVPVSSVCFDPIEEDTEFGQFFVLVGILGQVQEVAVGDAEAGDQQGLFDVWM